MNLLELTEQEIINKNIDIDYLPLEFIQSCCVTLDNGSKGILITDSIISNKEGKKCRTILLHELSHLECPRTMYDLDTSIYARKRRENIVNKYMIKNYIPVEILKRLLEKGLETFEIAEELYIEEKTIKEAIHLYKENGLLEVNRRI